MHLDRLRLAFALAVLTYGIGAVLALTLWPYLQAEWVPHFPTWVGPVAGFLAYWGVYATLGPMILGVLPPYHRFRVVGDAVGTIAFLVSLLYAQNSGSVAFNIGCLFLMIYSIRANWGHHEPVTANAGQWIRVFAILVGCYLFGQLVDYFWPVDAETQYPGVYWEYVALLGGSFLLFASIAALETRMIPGNTWQHHVLRGLGNLLSVFSCLGQYNQEWLTLCSSLVALMYGPMLVKAIRSKHEK